MNMFLKLKANPINIKIIKRKTRGRSTGKRARDWEAPVECKEEGRRRTTKLNTKGSRGRGTSSDCSR
jgi:hypothetical protein